MSKPNHKLRGFEEDVHSRSWRRWLCMYNNHHATRNDKAASRALTRAKAKEYLRRQLREES